MSAEAIVGAWEASMMTDKPPAMTGPHRPRPDKDKTHCRDCGRAIAKGARRPSGLLWRHVK